MFKCVLFDGFFLKGQTWSFLEESGKGTLAVARWCLLPSNPTCYSESLPLTTKTPFSVFKERRIVKMWAMQAGVLLRRGLSGRCGASWQEGLLFSGGWDTCCLCHRLLAPPLPTPLRAYQVCMNLPEVTSPGDRQLQLEAMEGWFDAEEEGKTQEDCARCGRGSCQGLKCAPRTPSAKFGIWRKSGKQRTA